MLNSKDQREITLLGMRTEESEDDRKKQDLEDQYPDDEATEFEDNPWTS